MILWRGGLVVALLAGSLAAVRGQDVQVTGRHFSYGVSLREAYDSNILAGDGKVTPIVSSFVTTISPNIHYTWSTPVTDLGLHYSYSAAIYAAKQRRSMEVEPDPRPWVSSSSDLGAQGRNLDQSHDFDLDVAHTFSPRLRATFREHFKPGFEPEIEQGARQFNGNYIQNEIFAGLNYRLNSRWSVPFHFAHFFMTYDDPTIAKIQNRQSVSGGLGLRYDIRPTSSLGVSYDRNITTYEDLNRSSEANTFLMDINHSFGPRLSARLGVGVTRTAYEVAEGSEMNPNINLQVDYKISPRTAVGMNFRAQTQPTEVLQYLNQQTYTLTMSLSHQFTARLMGAATVTYIPSIYDASLRTPSQLLEEQNFPTEPFTSSAPAGGTEDTLAANLMLAYQFNLHVRAEVGVAQTTVQSDLQATKVDPVTREVTGFDIGRSYDRTITYMQVSVSF